MLIVTAFILIAVHGRTQPASGQTPTSRSFRELGFGDQTARSMYGSVSYFLPVPPGQAPQPGSQIELIVSHSPLLAPDRSTMTVVVNDQRLVSTFLTPENRERSSLMIPLPVEAFSGAGYFVEVRVFMRLALDQCEETQNPALWATVHGDSRLTLPLASNTNGPGLQDLAGVLRPPSDDGNGRLTIGLPSGGGTAEELRAAGLVAFQYGRWAIQSNTDPLIEASTDPASMRSGVLVGTGGSLHPNVPAGPVHWDGQTFAGSSGAIPAGDGVLVLTGAERPLLLVSGATPEAVRLAAEAVAQPERRATLRGNAVSVADGDVAYNDLGRPWRDSAATFAQLSVDRRVFNGPGEHHVQLAFERPPGWTLKDGSTLDLVIESSSTVRSETSWVSVRVNGIDGGTQRLEPSGSEPGRYTFRLPADQLNTTLDGQPVRRLELEIRLYLDHPEGGCIQSAPESVRATLVPASAWRLPHDTYMGLDLGRFPAMFFSADRGPVAVVLPDAAGAVELTAALTVMAALGRWSGSDDAVWPRLVRAGDLTESERRSHHLILVGDPEQNAIGEAAARADRSLFEPVEPPVQHRNGSGVAHWGTLHLDRSPWGRSRIVLAVMGANAGGLDIAASALATRATLARLQGRTAVLTGDLPPQSVEGADPAPAPPTSLAPAVEEDWIDRMRPWQVVGAVLLGAFVIIVALTLIVRLRGRRMRR